MSTFSIFRGMWCTGALLTIAALTAQSASATEVLYSFSGLGEGAAGIYSERTPDRVQLTTVGGFAVLDTDQAVPYGNGYIYNAQGINPVGSIVSIYALVQDDLLYISLVNDGRATTGRFYNTYTLNALFNPGYLNGIFPTSIDFAQLISANFGASNNFCYARCETYTSFGSPTTLTASVTEGVSPRGDVNVLTTFVRAVPEPNTWAMMLVGFGAMGVSLRRRRRTDNLLQAA